MCRRKATCDVLICLTHFPAHAHRETVLWLCAHALMEYCSVANEQEAPCISARSLNAGGMARAPDPHAGNFRLVDAGVRPLTGRPRGSTAPDCKRYQAPSVSGAGRLFTRALRTETEINRACFGFVPLLSRRCGAQHAELSLTRLTEELNLNEMTRRPRKR